MDQRGGNAGVGVEVEVLDPLGPRKAGVTDEAGLAALLAVVAFDRQQLDQEALVAGLLAGCPRGRLPVPPPEGPQPPEPAGPPRRRGRRRGRPPRPAGG